MLTRPRFTILCLFTVVLFLFGSTLVNAQHETSGGSKDMMGGSTVGGNTGRAPTRTSSTKPPVKTNIRLDGANHRLRQLHHPSKTNGR
jgi:hypothetical protein